MFWRENQLGWLTALHAHYGMQKQVETMRLIWVCAEPVHQLRHAQSGRTHTLHKHQHKNPAVCTSAHTDEKSAHWPEGNPDVCTSTHAAENSARTTGTRIELSPQTECFEIETRISPTREP